MDNQEGKKGKYRFIDDLTSDVMFEAYGKDLKEVFENAAEALFTVICQIDKVGHKIEKEIVVQSEDTRNLMIDWLQELIARVDVEELFFSRFEIQKITQGQGLRRRGETRTRGDRGQGSHLLQIRFQENTRRVCGNREPGHLI